MINRMTSFRYAAPLQRGTFPSHACTFLRVIEGCNHHAAKRKKTRKTAELRAEERKGEAVNAMAGNGIGYKKPRQKRHDTLVVSLTIHPWSWISAGWLRCGSWPVRRFPSNRDHRPSDALHAFGLTLPANKTYQRSGPRETHVTGCKMRIGPLNPALQPSASYSD